MDSTLAGTQILPTKLHPPQLPPIVSRERVLRELDAGTSAKLTTIIAGAGFGKTTLAAEFIKSRNLASVWYQLEDTDCDFTVFIAYLLAALRELSRDFGSATLDAMKSSEEERLRNRGVLTALISEIETQIDHEFFVVLDDFQMVNESRPIVDALNFLLAHMPPTAHLMILGSGELNLDLSKLRARRELIELRERQLSFAADETAELFSRIFCSPIGEDDVAAITDLTEGWISGLVLLNHALKHGGGALAKNLVGGSDIPVGEVSQYLDRFVYQNQDDRVREFMLKTSLLSSMDSKFCNALLEEDSAQETLAYLTKEHLFTLPLDEEGHGYRYHHLLRAFLQRQLADTASPEELCELNRRAASLWEERGDLEEALGHYMAAMDHERVAEVLDPIVDGWVTSGRMSFVHHILSQLPRATLTEHPRLLFNLSLAFEHAGHSDKAFESYQEAAALFAQEGQVGAQFQSLANAARICMLGGRPAEAERIVNIMLEIVPEGSDSWYEIPAPLGTEFTLLGFGNLQEHLLEEASSRLKGAHSESLRIELLMWCGYASLFRGESERALDILNQACRMAERSDLTFLLPLLHMHQCIALIGLGRYDEARETADMGLELGASAMEGPFVLLNRPARALSLSLLNHQAEALEEISLALELSEGIESGYLAMVSELFAGSIYWHGGNVPQSIKHYKRAEQLANTNKIKDAELLARMLSIGDSLDANDGNVARQDARSVVEELKARNAGIILCLSYVKLACIERSFNDRNAARDALESAITLDEKGQTVGWWKVLDDQILPIIADEFSQGEHMNFLARALAVMGPDSLPFLYPLKASRIPKVKAKARDLIGELKREVAEPLKIRMLGRFEVVRGEDTIRPEAWKSKKALAVLKYLAAHHNSGDVPRDVLMELLWPERSPDFASKNLNKALPALRRTLEPQAGWGESQHLIVSGNSLRLELGRGGWIDIEVFQQTIDEAREAEESGDTALRLEKLLEAEALYDGEFLAGDPYEDWCQPIRQSIRDEYVDLLESIADEYLRADDKKRALACVEKAIASDLGREGLYRRVMEISSQMGDRVGMEKAYERCRKYLDENFDVSPSPETMGLYKTLRKG
jgi:ATP/maltotriose-dependent transcriptional regulator MalT/DNA-binding SARP family transcriptional activator